MATAIVSATFGKLIGARDIEETLELLHRDVSPEIIVSTNVSGGLTAVAVHNVPEGKAAKVLGLLEDWEPLTALVTY